MFGLAIWDVPNKRLVVARDAMGIKLIYYKIDNGQLHFRIGNPCDSGRGGFQAGGRSRRAQICFSGFVIRLLL